MKNAALIALLAVTCFAEDAPKPICNARNPGEFWPQEANSSKDAAHRFFQSGELEICTRGVWKYRWEHVSVNVRDLGKGKRRSNSDPTQPANVASQNAMLP